jgi:hypothetical protein
MKQTPSYPPRRNLRVPDFDYSQPGAYYVTIVTHERKQLFGQIVDGEMVLNEIGKMVKEVWIAIPKHFPNVEFGEFVIMPNHIHGIISITVGATHASPLRLRVSDLTAGLQKSSLFRGIHDAGSEDLHSISVVVGAKHPDK